MKKKQFALGSLLLGAVSWLCLRGLQHIERRIKRNRKSKKATIPVRRKVPPDGDRFVLFGIIFFVLAALVLLMSLYAAHCVVAGGMEIGSIESVGGKTLEEGYYQELATVYAGYAAMIRATGIFFSSILAYIGLKN